MEGLRYRLALLAVALVGLGAGIAAAVWHAPAHAHAYQIGEDWGWYDDE
jgi:hypothetical protein